MGNETILLAGWVRDQSDGIRLLRFEEAPVIGGRVVYKVKGREGAVRYNGRAIIDHVEDPGVEQALQNSAQPIGEYLGWRQELVDNHGLLARVYLGLGDMWHGIGTRFR